jgi:hypothetical protein
MKRIVPILALAAAATLAGPSLATSATARAAVQGVAPVAVMDVTSVTQLSNGKWRHTFTGANSYDPDGTITSYYWKPDGACLAGGTYSTTYTMDIPDGHYCTITLTVTDNSSSTDSEVLVIVGGW